MSCVYPIKIKNPYFKVGGIKYYERQKYYDVPCGKCINCINNKKIWLQTACEWEYNYYGCGAFVTLTYDDKSYIHLYNKEKDDYVADYRDLQLFLKRLRQNIYRKYNIRHEFKYLATTEYGGENGRIHYHILFFGLDFQNNELDIFKAWNMGITDCKPIDTSGKAINYVLKYMTKDEVRSKKKYNFGKNEEAYIKYSKGLGKGFIDENINFIYEHQGCYDRGDGVLISLPPYWCNRLRLKPIVSYNDTRKEMIAKNWNKRKVSNWWEISKEEAMQYKYDLSVKKEKIAIEESRKIGIPQEDFDNYYAKCYKKLKF